MGALKRWLENPSTNIAIALVLVVSSVAEGWGEFVGGISKFEIGVHHGVLLFGLAMLLRGIIEAMEAVERAHKRARSREGVDGAHE